MRIALDVSSISPFRTGIGNYTLNLVKHLLKIDQQNEYLLFFNSFRQSLPDYPFFHRPNVTLKRYYLPGPLLLSGWRGLNLPPIELFVGKVDLFHSPASYIPPQVRGKRVTTIHDLYFMRHPEQCERWGGKFLRGFLPRRLKKMDAIIAVSHATKRDLMELFGLPAHKITVIYEGVDTIAFRPLTDQELLRTIREEYCLPPKYILTVSTLEPRKNLEGLLFAYKRLQEILHRPPKLVIVGRKSAFGDQVLETVKRLDLYLEVIFLGYVAEEHLPLIYNNALLFVYPSLYEGFGLPVLEAMACRLPVIISNNSSLLEIAGDAALAVDPYNYYEMAEQLKQLITSHSLRQQLREKASRFTEKFNWELCARKTLALYRQLVK